MKFSIVKISFFIILAFIYFRCVNHHNTVPEPDAATQPGIPEDNQLKILSWNIKMFPAPYGWLFKPYKRAANIVQVLKESDGYDIIFFQEAFSGSIRRKIYAKLQNIYPHEVEPDDQTAFYKINSGLWVISRLPITLKNHISFTQFRESDKLASKGAKLFSVKKDKQNFHLINTHMQADYEKINSDVRILQYTEIYNQLILPYEKEVIPLILCGDLNISEPGKLKKMMDKLKLQNGPLMGMLQHSTIGRSKELLDYILIGGNYSKFKSIKRRVIDFSFKLKEKEYNLSDHYPLEAVFSW